MTLSSTHHRSGVAGRTLAAALTLGLTAGVAEAAPKSPFSAAMESFQHFPPQNLSDVRAPADVMRPTPVSTAPSGPTYRRRHDGPVAKLASLGRVIPPEPGRPLLRFFDAVAACADVDLTAGTPPPADLAELGRAPRLDRLERFWRAEGLAPKSILLGAEVPPLFLAKLPSDMNDEMDVPRKKRGFVMMMLPHILAVNEEIMADRDRVLSLTGRLDDVAEEPADAELDWLFAKFRDYRVDDFDLDTLLARMDAIPPALAIAQAAKESGWGSSRFAKLGNAMYGQWTWNPADKGIVPKKRPAGKTYRVRAFDDLLDATRAYARNINSHPAYGRLREIRRKLRRAGKSPSGLELTRALDKYSTIGKRYVRALNRIIKTNDLVALNGAVLAETAPAAPAAPATLAAPAFPPMEDKLAEAAPVESSVQVQEATAFDDELGGS